MLLPHSAFAAPAPAATDSMPRATRERVGRELHTLILDRFAHWEGVPEFRFPARYESYRSHAPVPPAEPDVTDRWLVPDSVGYIAIRSFGKDANEAQALEAVRKRYREARALIVDVRGNGGGNTPRTLIKTLLDGRPYTWWKEDPNRLPMSALDQMGAATRRAGSVRPTYRGTLILLVDGDCASACEDFVMPLVWEHRATAVGDTTCGSTGQPVFASFDNGIMVSVSAKCAHLPDGAAFEGVGIAPTLRVPRSRADVVSGADRALQTALQLARGATPRAP